jgi:RsiW-degrading membrane proteinase PrsW (M82 family)
MPDPERGRRLVGLLLYVLGMVLGALLLFVFFVFLPATGGPATFLLTLFSMAVAAFFAFPAALVYLTVPRLLDRYDPEPTYALVLAFLWGAVAACGFSVLVNSLVSDLAAGAARSMGYGDAAVSFAAEFAGAVISAPITEEASKGALLLGFYLFLRREFDGVVDGIIYACFVAIGFAALENVIYYARSGVEFGAEGFLQTFVLRGMLTPWGHPLYTSMTGIGVGLARETSRTWLRFAAPVIGYGAAVFLHAFWNFSAVMAGRHPLGQLIFVGLLFLWLLFLAAFLAMVLWLVLRRGAIIRSHLVDEVLFGNLSEDELRLATSAFGGVTARFRKGAKGVEFVRAVARLGLSKWHSARAHKAAKRTVSMDFIVPLRQKIQQLRAEGASPVPGPQPRR